MNGVAEHSLRTQEILEIARNYNAWIYGMVRPWLGRRVADVGCSIGNITRFFLDRERVVGIDLSPEAVDGLRRRYGAASNLAAWSGDIADPDVAERLAKERPDTVTCINVLEHVRDDERALAHMRGALVPGGRVLLIVPALMALYGTMDSADGHYRRYTKRTLARAIRGAGLRVESMRYFNFVGMFGWFWNGRILGKKYVPEGQLGWYDRLVPFFRMLEEGLRPGVGQSLFAAARKDG